MNTPRWAGATSQGGRRSERQPASNARVGGSAGVSTVTGETASGRQSRGPGRARRPRGVGGARQQGTRVSRAQGRRRRPPVWWGGGAAAAAPSPPPGRVLQAPHAPWNAAPLCDEVRCSGAHKGGGPPRPPPPAGDPATAQPPPSPTFPPTPPPQMECGGGDRFSASFWSAQTPRDDQSPRPPIGQRWSDGGGATVPTRPAAKREETDRERRSRAFGGGGAAKKPGAGSRIAQRGGCGPHTRVRARRADNVPPQPDRS